MVALKTTGPSAGLARTLSKLGYCSRREAEQLILAGRVRIDSMVCQRIDQSVDLGRSTLTVDGKAVGRERPTYLMLNKPRGLVTTASDERGRPTVFQCLEGAELPRLVPVGRLDQASEGLLLFTNDTQWANAITDPASRCEKVYHVHATCQPSPEFINQLLAGVTVDGELLRVCRAETIRVGPRNCWMELSLNEGKNRHLRRLLAALGVDVLQLVRIAIGPLVLGDLPKGQWRQLTPEQARSLAPIIQA